MQKDDARQRWIAEGGGVKGDVGYGCWHGDEGNDIFMVIYCLIYYFFLLIAYRLEP